jgi:hypothetical protein
MGTVDDPVQVFNAMEGVFVLFASRTSYFYKALIEAVDFINTSESLPESISFDLADKLFRLGISTACKVNNIADSKALYKKWLGFLLRFSPNPFSVDIFTVMPQSVLNSPLKRSLSKYWNNNAESIPQKYLPIFRNIDEKNYGDVARFLDLSLMDAVFEKYYWDKDTAQALSVLNHLPKNWKTYWNAHLCEPKANKYLDALLLLLNKEKNMLDDQDILILQLELKVLLNNIEDGLEQEGVIDRNVLNRISKELEPDIALYGEDSDEVVDKYTQKIYEKIIFSKVKSVYQNIPKEISREHRLALYIDIKRVLEFCEDFNIVRATPLLAEINKVLFEEINDSASGVELILLTLKNGNHKTVCQYLKKLVPVLNQQSVDMDTLFENFIIKFASSKINQKDYNEYLSTFSELRSCQFTILKELLSAFRSLNNTDESTYDLNLLGACVAENANIFQKHSQTYYILVDSVISKRFTVGQHQNFVRSMLSQELPVHLLKNFLSVLIEHFYEQPYRDFTGNFPTHGISNANVKHLKRYLDDKIFSLIEDDRGEEEFVEKHDALNKSKTLFSIMDKERVYERSI